MAVKSPYSGLRPDRVATTAPELIVERREDELSPHLVVVFGLVGRAFAQLGLDHLFFVAAMAVDQHVGQIGGRDRLGRIQDAVVQIVQILAADRHLLLPITCSLCLPLNHGALLMVLRRVARVGPPAASDYSRFR